MVYLKLLLKKWLVSQSDMVSLNQLERKLEDVFCQFVTISLNSRSPNRL